MFYKIMKCLLFNIKNLGYTQCEERNILAQNIHFGYTLEPLRLDGSNEYAQSMFWIENKKNRYTPANPSLSIYGGV